MALANYTTKVPVRQTLDEIQHLLVQAGAISVMVDYDEEKLPVALSFRIVRGEINIAFRLPCDWRATLRILRAQRVISYAVQAKEADARAQRVAWRICGDWLRAQLALVQIGAAALEQVMLPYAITPDGGTLYERMAERGFSGLALPAPNNEATAIAGTVEVDHGHRS